MFPLLKEWGKNLPSEYTNYIHYGATTQDIEDTAQILEIKDALEIILKDMEEKNFGYILNVASSAGLMPGGPLMATYYATKAYVRSLTEAIYYEEKKKKKNIKVSLLCPGPVDTNFNKVAGVKFGFKPLSADYVAKYAIDNMFKGKMNIIPGKIMKLVVIFSKFISEKRLLKSV